MAFVESNKNKWLDSISCLSLFTGLRYQWLLMVCLFLMGLQGAFAAERALPDKNLPASSFDAHGRSKIKCEDVTDSQGKKYQLVRMVNVTYKIPAEFYPNSCGESGLRLNVSWSRAKGLEAPAPDYNVSRPFVVLLDAPQLPRRKDRYEIYNRRHKFDQDRIPTEFPGLFRLSENGKPLRLLMISSDKGPKTPSGNPYLFDVDETNLSVFDITVALPGGNSFRINDGNVRKHLSDWDRLFPALVRLLQSFEQRN